MGGFLTAKKLDRYNTKKIVPLETRIGNLEALAASHNAVFRGKSLGTSISSAQSAAIRAGTFDDIYVGDYWTINGTTYRIAGCDYYINCGDQGSGLTTHHVILVPDSQLGSAKMNDTNVTTGGYKGSAMYTINLQTYRDKVATDLGDHLITHREYISNAVNTDGHASGGEWVDAKVELMNECMVYGGVVNGGTDGFGLYNIGALHGILPLFLLAPRFVNTRQAYWLRDVCTGADFAYVSFTGSADHYYASASLGVRPFAIAA